MANVVGNENGQAHSEAYGVVSNFNFWEVNCYRTTIKRMEDGSKLCDDFMKMVNERAEIETMYFNKMKC
jgi:hypothetical protein